MQIKTGVLDGLITFFESEIKPTQLQQSIGNFDDCGCCVGAWLARYFGIESRKSHDFIRGFNELAMRLQINRPHLIVILAMNGATDTPEGKTPWPTPPAQVFRNLLRYEKPNPGGNS